MSTTDTNPALVAWVAEHVMGWRQDPKHAFVFYDDANTMYVVGDQTWTPRCPHKKWNPLTDANDDLMVLQKVRDEWLCEDLFTFECEYSAALAVRDVDGVRGVELHILQHVVGDYARAAAQAKGYKP